ncbi:hypothetical protein [Paractinoplanes rishiriensis]|uniref:Uncharacterized protein n=1 Tax=Paractinoplanes rishiriensis TaxID=1050105 RepID=A0A919KA57_9ACTN|nr:hypothetical protein [Actinoplanes rishiriensis]GIF01563.1 hypothetical protein Ari01nite_90270 [Actinoplanes rishiriensis]
MIDTLLLDVEGVVQFPRAQFVADIERDYRWRAGYLAFEQELLHDPGEARALVGDGDLLDVVARVLAGHVTGVTPRQFLDRWLAERIEPNHELLDLLPRLNVTQIFLITNQEVRRAAAGSDRSTRLAPG